MLTIGYIGNGKTTNRYHLPYVLLRKNICVKTIYQRDLSKKNWDQIENVHYTDNLEELLNDPAIQLIVVATTSDSHYHYTKLALEHGKHVVCDKPFVETYAQAKELFDLARKLGLHLQTYQNRRYDSDFLTVQKVIESGKLGDVYEIEMSFDYYRPETPNSIHEFKMFDSFIYGHGSHTIDQVLSYYGNPDKVHYDVKQILGENRFNDYFDLDLYYKSMKVSIKSSYFRIKARPSFVVYGTKGMFVKHTPDRQEEHLKLFYLPGKPGFGEDSLEHYGTITYQECGQIKEEKVTSCIGDYGRTYDDVYQVIINNADPVIKEEHTLIQMQIMETGAKMCK